MNKLEFVTKSVSTTSHGGKDVTILCTRKSDKPGVAVYFTFRNGVERKICPNTSCIAYAVIGTKLYFKEVSEKEGYRVSDNKNNKGTNYYLAIRCTNEAHKALGDFATRFEGDYDLLFDQNYKCWYVETRFSFFGKGGGVVNG